MLPDCFRSKSIGSCSAPNSLKRSCSLYTSTEGDHIREHIVLYKMLIKASKSKNIIEAWAGRVALQWLICSVTRSFRPPAVSVWLVFLLNLDLLRQREETEDRYQTPSKAVMPVWLWLCLTSDFWYFRSEAEETISNAPSERSMQGKNEMEQGNNMVGPHQLLRSDLCCT